MSLLGLTGINLQKKAQRVLEITNLNGYSYFMKKRPQLAKNPSTKRSAKFCHPNPPRSSTYGRSPYHRPQISPNPHEPAARYHAEKPSKAAKENLQEKRQHHDPERKQPRLATAAARRRKRREARETGGSEGQSESTPSCACAYLLQSFFFFFFFF